MRKATVNNSVRKISSAKAWHMMQDGSTQAHSNTASAMTQQPLAVTTLTHTPSANGITGGSLL